MEKHDRDQAVDASVRGLTRQGEFVLELFQKQGVLTAWAAGWTQTRWAPPSHQSDDGSGLAARTSRATPATDRDPAPGFVHSTSRPDATWVYRLPRTVP
jgi:hypothetical protein